MDKILGIDTGTNSLGWAIVEKNGDDYRLIDKGTNIFQEGVKVDKGVESSKAAERTMHRALRVRYYRIKLRKIRLLRILSDNNLCPPLSKDMLSGWRLKKEYPQTELFMKWQSTDDVKDVNPYHYRHVCLHTKLDLSDISQRYILGRALYHLIQRRGFLSNRKSQDDGDEGKVKGGISQLSEDMDAAGCEYLGDYFYSLYKRGEKIRNHYTARNEHYLKEFMAICKMQNLDDELINKLGRAIFFQRPLKSQKGQVGRCVFEKNKAKCPSSHPLYEEYRMLTVINNIKIQTPKDNELRPLNEEERKLAMTQFFRKSKKNFDFEDIAKKIAGKGKYGHYKKEPNKQYLFNYYMDSSVSGSVVTASLIEIFGEDWLDSICETYTLAEGKSQLQILNDVWHALLFYSDNDKLAEFAKQRLQLDDTNAEKFSKISMPSDYAALSLNVICKILPYLRRGLIYSHAVFLANLDKVMPAYEWNNEDMREAAIDKIIEEINGYDPKTDTRTLEVCIKEYLKSEYNISDEDLLKLYHPSMIESYPQVRPKDNGLYQLGSPRTDSIRNPMAMRSMFRMRKLVNELLSSGKIDKDTTIHIEFARELNDANKRNAIASLNRINQKKHDDAKKEIIELYKAETGKDIEPTDIEVLKYILWEEQDHMCIYTGKKIGIADFVGANPSYDIEHTIPQSAGGDSTSMNLTLCSSRYNRDVKKTKLPTELAEYSEILKHIEPWKEKYEALDKQIRRQRTGGAATKEAKDSIIQKRHLLELQRDYWKGKYHRFEMKEVPEGFSRRQGTDISVISKYARLFLKSVFPKVYIVKGIATSDFRKIWGIQELYSKKERVNHVHHCIDAIVIACIGPDEYSKLAHYYHEAEEHKLYGKSKGTFKMPWDNFVTDIKNIQEQLLVYHYTADNMQKQGKRHIKIGGKKVLAEGDAARGSLHNDTYYGAIQKDGDLKYVVRKPLSGIKETDIKNIVDEEVKEKVQDAIDKHGFKEAMEGTIWMNEEKKIPIKKVRCFTPSVTNPLNIRQQRDQSPKEYKQQYHVMNDRNYMLALYIGKDKKGKEKRDFELINNLQAANFYRKSNDNESTGNSLVPLMSKHDYPLAYTLKIGTMVLLYENNPEEVWEGYIGDIEKRLYKVTGLSSMTVNGSNYGSIVFTFHQEAKKSGDIKKKNGVFKQNEEYRAGIVMLHTQINALVEGVDFKINEMGEIKRLR